MTFDAIVVGAGIMGSATAYALASSGRSVLVLEASEIGHRRGSSHGRSRIFRFSYPDVRYVRMAQEALPLWRVLEEASGRDLLIPTGGFDLGDGVEQNLAALEACGATAELVADEDIRQRWPQVRIPADRQALYSPDAAAVRAGDAWRAFIDLARRAGGDVRTGVRAVRLDRSGVVTTEDGATHRADSVVVTAGAWARPLLATAGIDLAVRPTRETVAYFELPGGPPPAFVEWGNPTIYALTDPGGGLKVGEHIAGPEADPDTDGAPDEGSIERITRWVSERFPQAARTPHQTETCFYTNTRDESFVLERHDNIVVGSPCSGHGFKFAPLIGKRLAQLCD